MKPTPSSQLSYRTPTTDNIGWLLPDALAAAPHLTILTPAQKAQALQSILNTALVGEQIVTAFYYAGLTSKGVLGDPRLCGVSANPHDPGLPPGGNPANVRDLQACLDAEVKHVAAFVAVASSPYRRFYFPATTFASLGSTPTAGTFLGVMESLETTLLGLYIAAVNEVLQLGRVDLAATLGEVLGVEAEHRVLGRVFANIDPANNLTLQKAPFTSVAQAATALRPYVTGQGHADGSTRGYAMPTASQAASIVGKYGTHIVTQFLQASRL